MFREWDSDSGAVHRSERLRVLIALDKFKGTLPAEPASEAVAGGWRRVRREDKLVLLPITDGGDGFGEAMGRILGGHVRCAKAVDAAGRDCLAKWWWASRARTAVVESANVIGLAMLPALEFHPFRLDTLGLGIALEGIARMRPRRCLVGIGGSATNDGGFGMARALGWQFVAAGGKVIDRWTGLDRLREIHPPKAAPSLGELTVAVDVRNPLLGPQGATRVYGPQKGLRRSQFAGAERCLARLAEVFKMTFGQDFAAVPGAGAAGGLGFGFVAFLGAQLEPGFELFSRYAALQGHLEKADLVITGEGRIDRSTFMGKGVGQIAMQCCSLGVPCVGLAGMIEGEALGNRVFTRAHALTELTSAAEAKSNAALWLERLAERLARDVCPGAPVTFEPF